LVPPSVLSVPSSRRSCMDPDLGWRLAYLTGAGLGLIVVVR
jgi:hypothetical protein